MPSPLVDHVAMSRRSPLIDVAWLALHVADPSVRIADCRWYLSGKRGADAYAAGRIPGAVFLDLGSDLSDPNANGPGRHPLPEKAGFVATLARLGIGPETIVVGYDDAGGSIAARLWWMLRWIGHGGGRVLDGGIQAWTRAGYELSTAPARVEPAPPMTLRESDVKTVDKRAVDELRGDAKAVVIDARANDRFEGKLEPIDARPGHIPGARSVPFAGNLGADGKFLEGAELATRYREAGALDADRIAVYCGSGVTACHDLLALTLLGREDAMLYPGSWSDWARDESLPAALGSGAGAAESNSRDNAVEKR